MNETAVDSPSIQSSQPGDLLRQSKDNVKILYRQQLSIPFGQPLDAGRPLTLRATAIATRNGELTITCLDRHRGGGCPPTPATPPCVRVRTRRFESVTLTPINQRRKPERFEVGIGKPHREGLGLGEVPGAPTAPRRMAGPAWPYSQSQPNGPPAPW